MIYFRIQLPAKIRQLWKEQEDLGFLIMLIIYIIIDKEKLIQYGSFMIFSYRCMYSMGIYVLKRVYSNARQYIRLKLIFNNKAQIKQLMSHLRVRPLEKPFIVHSLEYSHRPQHTENSSEASFLKLSEKNSQELAVLQGSNIFEEIQERLNRMETSSIRKIHEVQAKILTYNHEHKRGQGYSGKVMNDKIQAQLAYRIQQGLEQCSDECKFEMDQNRNYVRASSQESSSNLVRRLIEAKEILSEPQWQAHTTLKHHSQKSSKTQSRRSSFCNRSQASPAHQARPCMSRSINTKRKSGSSCKSSRAAPTGIYEQILSNYSTAKLLAMHKSASDS